jgi:UDP-N-acetylglucosamine--N-acetylmuramyl-(pentapeptide) pyrophosphoryl-undecaprenol N-acetylglucosamine transferase
LTLAALAIAGRPAILIPLPTAADDHPREKAAQFASAGVALVLDQGTAHAQDLAGAIAGLARNQAAKPRAPSRARRQRKPSSIIWKSWCANLPRTRYS